MGLKAVQLLQQTGKAVSKYTDDVVGLGVRKWTKPTNLEGLRFAPETIGDTVKFSTTPISKNIKSHPDNTLVDDIVMYIEGYKQKGEHFIPASLDTSSPTFKFIEYCKEMKFEPTVERYKEFLYFKMKSSGLNVSREELLKIIELQGKEVAEELKKIPGINPKIIDKAPKIQQWSDIIFANSSIGKLQSIRLRPGLQMLQDDVLYQQTLRDLEQFAMEISGKKVLLVGDDKMMPFIDCVLSLGNPKLHQGTDYIIMGHGTGSSLITDILNPNTWRFEDTNQSVWEFIEKNIPKGKKCLVCTCEEHGLELAGKTLKEMVDKKGKLMYGIGNPVMTSGYPKSHPLKYCESGVRHIIGHAEGKDSRLIFGYMRPASITQDWEIVNYAL